MKAPMEGYFVWKVSDFSKTQTGIQLDSKVFTVGGCKWYTALYPKGRNSEAEGFCSMYLHVSEPSKLPSGWEISTEYKFVVRSHSSDIPPLVECLDKKFDKSATSWGKPKWVSSEILTDLSKKYIHDDTIEIEVHICVQSTTKYPRAEIVVPKTLSHGTFCHPDWRFSPDGSKVAVRTADSVRIWKTSPGHRESALCCLEGITGLPSWSPDGSLAACPTSTFEIQLWDCTTGKVKFTLSGHNSMIALMDWAPDGGRLASGSKDGEVRVWDVKDGECQQSWTKKLATNAKQLEWSPDGKRLAAMNGLVMNQLSVWNDAESIACLPSFQATGLFITLAKFAWKPVSYLDTESNVITTSGFKEFQQWNVTNGKLVRTISNSRVNSSDFTWSPDGELLVWPDEDGGIHAINLLNGVAHESFFSESRHVAGVKDMCWTSDGLWLVTRGEDGEVRFHNRSTLESHSCKVRVADSSDLLWFKHANALTFNSGETLCTYLQPDDRTCVAESFTKKIAELIDARVTSSPPPPTLPPTIQKVAEHIQDFVNGEWPVWNEGCNGLSDRMVRAKSAHRELSACQEALRSESQAVAAERVEERDRLRSQLIQALDEVVAWEWQDQSVESKSSESGPPQDGSNHPNAGETAHGTPPDIQPSEQSNMSVAVNMSNSGNHKEDINQPTCSRVLHLEDVLNKVRGIISSLSDSLNIQGTSVDHSCEDVDHLVKKYNDLLCLVPSLQSKSQDTLESVTEWRGKHDLNKVTENTMSAIKEFSKALGNVEEMRDALIKSASVLDNKMRLEADFRRNDNPEIDIPTPKVVEMGTKLCEYAREVCTFISRLKESLEWAHGELHFQSEAHGTTYPPSLDQFELCIKCLDDVHDLKDVLDIKTHALVLMQNRNKSTEKLEMQIEDIKSRLPKGRKSPEVALVQERSRLYALAHTHFPELLLPGHPWNKTIGLDPSNMSYAAQQRGLLTQGRRLVDFPIKETVRGNANKHVYRAVDSDGKEWALKSFKLTTETSMRKFYRHVAALDMLVHPHLTAVTTVFQHADPCGVSGVVQMPWYSGGDLSQWLDKHPPLTREMEHCKQVILDITMAVEHLHRNGLVHSDVKPSNVFLTASMRAVLGDFDGMRETDCTFTGTLCPGTRGYIAPELLKGEVSTAASDIYSLGVMVREMFEGMELGEKTGDVSSLVEAATQVDATKRPSAGEFYKHSLFDAPVKQLKHQKCVSCWDIRLESHGVECSSTCTKTHFLCSECAEQFMKCECESRLQGGLLSGREVTKLPCPGEGCESSLTITDLAKHVSEGVHSDFISAMQVQMEHTINHKLGVQFQERERVLREELLQKFKMDAVDAEAHQKELHIIENILITRCPRCTQAFVDFGGCFALTCSRCKAGICGWCLKDCGPNAHDHVKRCEHNAFRHTDPYFAPVEMFNQSRNSFRIIELKEFLHGVDGELLARIETRIKPHLESLGISMELVFEKSP